MAFHKAPHDSRLSFSCVYNLFEHLYFNHLENGKASKAEVVYFPGNKHCKATLAVFLLSFETSSFKSTQEEDIKVIQEQQALRRVLCSTFNCFTILTYYEGSATSPKFSFKVVLCYLLGTHEDSVTCTWFPRLGEL